MARCYSRMIKLAKRMNGGSPMLATSCRGACLAAGILMFVAGGDVSVGQLLMSDDFDTGNAHNGAPGGWTLSVPSGTSVRVVDGSVVTPASGAFSVELADNSATGRPEAYMNFRTTSSGRAKASFYLPATSNGPCSIQFRTSAGAFLCALIFGSNGLMGYDNTGTGTINSSVSWTAGVWQTVELEWFGDHTFNASVNGVPFANRLSFASAADPGRVILVAGFGSATGKVVYFDDVEAVVTEARLSDDFDAGNSFGSNPAGWTVAEPAGTDIRVVDGSVQPPVSPPYCVEFSDNSASAAPEMYANFAVTGEGRAMFSALVPSTNQAPFYMHLRATNGAFLAALRFGEDGKMAYNANAGGSGAFTVSSASWTPGAWETVSVDWFANNTFRAYLGSNQFAANVAFGTNVAPSRLLFRAANATQSGRLAYVDEVLVSRAVYPGTARYTENGAWLARGYVTAQTMVDKISVTAFQLSTNYHAPYWFANMGVLADSSGLLTSSSPKLADFLNAVKSFEDSRGVQLTVLAWFNGTNVVNNLGSTTIRANIVEEARRMVSATVTGSYVAGANRAFDGVQYDLEPSGQNTTRFKNLLKLVDETRAAFNGIGAGDKLIGFTPHKYGTDNEWSWSAQFYYDMARKVDLLCAMTYSTGITNGPAYQTWMHDQTTNILRAVSGKYWNNNSKHPIPTNGVKVMIGFPAMPNSDWHTNTAENIFYAAPGAEAGLAALRASNDHSTNFFLGAVIYLHADGTGTDGFAGYDQDWWWFATEWLKSW